MKKEIVFFIIVISIIAGLQNSISLKTKSLNFIMFLKNFISVSFLCFIVIFLLDFFAGNFLQNKDKNTFLVLGSLFIIITFILVKRGYKKEKR